MTAKYNANLKHEVLKHRNKEVDKVLSYHNRGFWNDNTFEKKPYKLDLHVEADVLQKTRLLGTPQIIWNVLVTIYGNSGFVNDIMLNHF